MNEDDKVHIGKLIQSRLKEDGRSATWLAQKLHYSRNNVYKIFEKQSIDTELLLHICIVLNFDFFTYYSQSVSQIKHN